MQPQVLWPQLTGGRTSIGTQVISLSMPICSMYGIFTYIWLRFMVNVGKYSMRWWYGIENPVFFYSRWRSTHWKCQTGVATTVVKGGVICRDYTHECSYTTMCNKEAFLNGLKPHYVYIYIMYIINIWYPPPKDLPVLFFTGMYVFLQFCAFLQILDFWRGICLEPSPTLQKKRVPHMYQVFLFSL